jgi:formylglycine-generating enzyme required for sulfatase activity
MLFCPAGESWMGTDDPLWFNPMDMWPRIRVRLTRGFWLAATPITVRQFVAIDYSSPYYSGLNPNSNAPMVLSWHEGESYLQKLNARLHGVTLETDQQQKLTIGEELRFDFPTQAQWEYACRAGTETFWHFGDDIDLFNEYGWSYDKLGSFVYETELPEVGLKKPNLWGFYDFYRLVAEWCKDDTTKAINADEQQQTLIDPLFMSIPDPTHKYLGYIKVTRGGAIDMGLQCCNSVYQTAMASHNEYGFNMGLRPALVFV